jgi:hypothetical protein
LRLQNKKNMMYWNIFCLNFIIISQKKNTIQFIRVTINLKIVNYK